MSINYDRLPQHLRAGARSYIEDGVPPGGFLTAVICNDLREAMGRADDINRERLADVVGFFYCEAPSDCCGSRECMVAWIDKQWSRRDVQQAVVAGIERDLNDES